MTDWFLLFSNTAAAGVRTVIGLYLIYRLLAARKPGKNSVITAAAGIAVISVILSVTGLSDLCRIACETVWIAVCANHGHTAQPPAQLVVCMISPSRAILQFRLKAV